MLGMIAPSAQGGQMKVTRREWMRQVAGSAAFAAMPRLLHSERVSEITVDNETITGADLEGSRCDARIAD
jgi:hypothetical protein